MEKRPLVYVLVSAALFGLSAPLSKILLRRIDPITLAGLLYFGAGLGLSLFEAGRWLFRRAPAPDAPLTGRDFPRLAAAVAFGGVAAPILLLLGLSRLSGFSTSLFLNLEAVMTALIAWLVFREPVGGRLWAAVAAMTGAGFFLGLESSSSGFAWTGALLVLAAMAAWGADNNLTRSISDKDPVRIARIKGLTAGAFSLGLAVALGRSFPAVAAVLAGMALGAVGYGLSLVLFIRALSGLGASRTGAFFSVGPFIGAGASLLILGDSPRWTMVPSLLLMAFGVGLIALERHAHQHHHDSAEHTHPHRHSDGHHGHDHPGVAAESHTHTHGHPETDHVHAHWPDIHHRHEHGH